MYNSDGNHVNVTKRQLLVRDNIMQIQTRNSRIQLLRKAVRHGLPQSLGNILLGINLNISQPAIRSQVIYSGHMVIMNVAQQYRIDFPKRLIHRSEEHTSELQSRQY